MSEIYFLSFRDMQVPVAGAVMPPVLYRAKGISPDYNWAAPGFWPRFNPGDPNSNPEKIEEVPHTEIVRLFRGKHVWFLVHGFNVKRDRGYMGPGAAAQELQFQGMLDEFGPIPDDTVVIPLLWPGDWYIQAVNYSFQFGDALEAGRLFADFVTRAPMPFERISFATHSFGVRIALECLRQTLKAQPSFGEDVFESGIFMAAADDNNVFDQRKYADAVAALDDISVISSSQDQTVKWAFPFGDFLEGLLWKDQHTLRRAMGYKGPKLKEDSPACGKITWLHLDKEKGIDHCHYLPWPWLGKGETMKDEEVEKNGWTLKRRQVFKAWRGFLTGNYQHEWPLRAKVKDCPRADP